MTNMQAINYAIDFLEKFRDNPTAIEQLRHIRETMIKEELLNTSQINLQEQYKEIKEKIVNYLSSDNKYHSLYDISRYSGIIPILFFNSVPIVELVNEGRIKHKIINKRHYYYI